MTPRPVMKPHPLHYERQMTRTAVPWWWRFLYAPDFLNWWALAAAAVALAGWLAYFVLFCVSLLLVR